MKYGYARVSTDDQNPALQLAALKRAPVFVFVHGLLSDSVSAWTTEDSYWPRIVCRDLKEPAIYVV